MYCPKCGHPNPDDANFCSRCGATLSGVEDATLTLHGIGHEETAEDTELAVSLDDLQVGQGMLVIMRGGEAGSKFLLDKDTTTCGRHPSSDIFLDDITVSRRHAEVQHEGGRFLVKDAGSLNGTYVNRERVDVAELVSGDEVQIGKFKLMFFTAPQEGS